MTFDEFKNLLNGYQKTSVPIQHTSTNPEHQPLQNSFNSMAQILSKAMQMGGSNPLAPQPPAPQYTLPSYAQKAQSSMPMPQSFAPSSMQLQQQSSSPASEMGATANDSISRILEIAKGIQSEKQPPLVQQAQQGRQAAIDSAAKQQMLSNYQTQQRELEEAKKREKEVMDSFGYIANPYEKYSEAKTAREEAESKLERTGDFLSANGIKPDERNWLVKSLHQIVGYDPIKVTGKDTNWWQLLKGAVEKGAWKTSNSIWNTLDDYLGEPAQEIHNFAVNTINAAVEDINGIFDTDLEYVNGGDNFITSQRKKSNATVKSLEEKYEANRNTSGAAQIVDRVGTETVAAIPFMLEAIIFGPTSKLVVQDAAYDAAGAFPYLSALGPAKTREAVMLMGKQGFLATIKKPGFWTSFVQTAGDSYEMAIEDGMNPIEATSYSLLNSCLNAMIEVGGASSEAGGIQNPSRDILHQMIDESVEEGAQDIVENTLELPHTKAPIFSLEDEKAAFNPVRGAEAMFGGGVVGGLLGAGQHGVGRAVSSIRGGSRKGASAAPETSSSSGSAMSASTTETAPSSESDALNQQDDFEYQDVDQPMLFDGASEYFEDKAAKTEAEIIALSEQLKSESDNSAANKIWSRINELKRSLKALRSLAEKYSSGKTVTSTQTAKLNEDIEPKNLPQHEVPGKSYQATQYEVPESTPSGRTIRRVDPREAAMEARKAVATKAYAEEGEAPSPGQAGEATTKETPYDPLADVRRPWNKQATLADNDPYFDEKSRTVKVPQRSVPDSSLFEDYFVDSGENNVYGVAEESGISRALRKTKKDVSTKELGEESRHVITRSERPADYFPILQRAAADVADDARIVDEIANPSESSPYSGIPAQTRVDLLNDLRFLGYTSSEYYVSADGTVTKAAFGNTENVKTDNEKLDGDDQRFLDDIKKVFRPRKDPTRDFKHSESDMGPASAFDRYAQRVIQEERAKAAAEAEQKKAYRDISATEEQRDADRSRNYVLSRIKDAHARGDTAEADAWLKFARDNGILQSPKANGKIDSQSNKGGNNNGSPEVYEGADRGRKAPSERTSTEVGRRAESDPRTAQNAYEGRDGGNGAASERRGHLSGNYAKVSKADQETQRRKVSYYEQRGAKHVDPGEYSESEKNYAKRAERFGASFIVMDASGMKDNVGAVTLPGRAGIVMFRNSGIPVSEKAQFRHEITHFCIRKALGSSRGTELLNKALNSAGISKDVRADIHDVYERLYANFYLRQLTGNENADFDAYSHRLDEKSKKLVRDVSALVDEEIFCDLIGRNTELFENIGDEVGDDLVGGRLKDMQSAAMQVAKDNKIYTSEYSPVEELQSAYSKSPDDTLYAIKSDKGKQEENPIPNIDEFEDADRSNDNEQYRQDRYNDTHGFDNAKGYEQQVKQDQKVSEEEVAAKKAHVKESLGESLSSVRDSISRLHSKLATDDTEIVTDKNGKTRPGKPIHSAENKAINRLREASVGYLDGKNNIEDVIDAYEDLNGKDSKKPNRLKNSYFYDKRVSEAWQKVIEDIEEIRKAEELSGEQASSSQLGKDVAYAFDQMATSLKYKSDMLPVRHALNSEMDEARVKPEKTGGKVEGTKVREFFTSLKDPASMFKMFGGFNSKKGKTSYEFNKRVRTSTANKINARAEAEDMFSGVAKLKGYMKFATGKAKSKVDLDVTSKKGKSIKKTLSMTEALDLYRSLETERGFDHALENGIKFSDKSVYTPTNKKDLAGIRASIWNDIMSDPVAKECYEVSKKANAFLREKINEVSQRMYGIDIANEEDTYWHLKIDWEKKNRGLSDGYRSLEDALFTKAKTGSKGALLVSSFNDAMGKYIDMVSDYVGYVELSRDLETLSDSFEGSTWLDSVAENFGEGAVDYIREWVNGMNGDLKSSNAFFKYFRSALAKNSLLLNPGVAIKQTASYFAASGDIDFDILLKNRYGHGNFLRTARGFEKNDIIKKVNEYTGFLKDRKHGSGSVVNEDSVSSRDIGGKVIAKFVPKWLSGWITTQDYRTVSNLALACYDQVARDNSTVDGFKAGSEEHFKQTAELLEQVVLETQPIYETNARAQYLRSKNDVVKTLAMFRTQPSQDFNHLYTAFGEWKAAKADGDSSAIKASSEKLANTIGGQIASKVAFGILGTLSRAITPAGRKKFEDDEGDFSLGKLLGRIGLDTVESAASTIWFGDTVSKYVIDLLSHGETNEFDEFGSNPLEIVTNAANSFLNFATSIASDEPVKLKTVQKFVTDVSSAFGVPAPNAYKLANAAAITIMNLLGENPDDFTDVFEYIDMQGRRNHSEAADAVFDALAAADVKLSDSVRYWNEVDADKRSGPSQKEIYAFYKNHPDEENIARIFWDAKDYNSSWEDYRDEHDLDGGKYIETKEALKKAKDKVSMFGGFDGYSSFEDIIKSDDYRNLSDEAKEKLNKSYPRLDDMAAATDAGISLDKWGHYYSAYKILNKLDIGANEKEARFLEMLYNDDTMSDKQKELLDDQFGFYSQNRGDAEKYRELRDADLGDKALGLYVKMSGIEPLEGHDSVLQIQKSDAIIDNDNLDDEEKLSALRIYTSDSYTDKVQTAYDAGVSLDTWKNVYAAYSEIDDRDLSAQQKANEFGAYLDHMVEKGELTEKQRNLLAGERGKDPLLVYRSGSIAESPTYYKLKDAGLSIDDAASTASALIGADSNLEKTEAIFGTGLSEDDKWRALKAATATGKSDAWYENVHTAVTVNKLPIDVYLNNFKKVDGILSDDEPNGRLSQAELYEFYKRNPDKYTERYVEIMWYAAGYSTTWEDYKKKASRNSA